MNSQQGPNSLPNHSPSTGVCLDEFSIIALESTISTTSSIAGTRQNLSTDVAPGVAVQEQVMLGGNSSNTLISPAKRSLTHSSQEFCEGESSNMGAEDALAVRLAAESHVNANNNLNSSPPLSEREIFSENAIIEPIQGHHCVIQLNEAGATPQPNSTANGQAVLLFRESSHSLPNLGPLPNLQRSLITGPPFPQTLNNFMAPLHGQRIFQRGTFSGHQIETANIPTSFHNHFQENYRQPYINSDYGVFIPRNISLHLSQYFNPWHPLQFLLGYNNNWRSIHNAIAFMYHQPLTQQAGYHLVDASNFGFQPQLRYEAFLQQVFVNLPSEPLLQFVDNNGTRFLHAQAIFNQSLRAEAASSLEIVHSGTENYNNQLAIPANHPQVINVEPVFLVYPFLTVSSQVQFDLEHVIWNIRLMEELRFLRLWSSVFETRNQQHSVSRVPQAGLNTETIMHHIRSDVFISEDEDKDKDTCAICYEDFEDGDEISKLDLCVHKFHIECIKGWLVQRNSCPICVQTALTMNNNENEEGVDANVEDMNV